MNAAVLSGSPTRSIGSLHGVVLAALALLGLGLTFLVWLHPTLGYAEPGSVIAGADLRADLTVILWSMLGTFAVVSTLGMALLRRATERRAVVVLVGYGAAAAILPLAMLVLDKFL
jgi:hypothetical protein